MSGFSPWRALVGWVSRGEFDPELERWLAAQLRSACSRMRTPVVIPDTRHDDATQEVFLKLLEKGPSIVDGIVERHPDIAARAECVPLDRLITRYVRVMLGNWWLSQERRRRPADGGDALDDVPAPEAAEAPDVERALEGVRAALELVVATRNVDDQDARRTFAELVDLATGARTMDEVLAETMAREGEPPGAAKRVRERLYRRHRLLREKIDEAIDELERSGDLSPDDGLLTRALLTRVLNRRPNRSGSGVQRPGGEG